MDDIERKTVKFEVKDVDEEKGTFTGYAATFSKFPDAYGDIIEPGAFKKTLKEMANRIKILWNHYVLEPIGKPTKLEEDEKGLFVEGKLSMGVQRAREIISLMKDGVITEMSIGYNTMKESYVEGVRHLQEVKLWDISPVTFAANPEAVILGVKELEGKPYPNEHACRLRDPDDFQEGSFRRTTRKHDDKKYSVIMGRLEGETTLTEQAYRYDKEIWEAAEAKSHCKDHDGTFEAAEKEEDKSGRVLSASNAAKIRSALSALQALLDAASEDEGAEKFTPSPEVVEEAARLEATIAGLKADNDGFDVQEAEKRIESILERLKPKSEVKT